MTENQSLELILEFATNEGMASFVDNNSGKKYFRSGEGNKIRPFVNGQDNHPMMLQGSTICSLAKKGRKFNSIKEADHYVDIIEDSYRMLLCAWIAEDPSEDKENRKLSSECVIELQETIKKNCTYILNKVSDFDKIKKYLDMSSKQIYFELKKKAESVESTGSNELNVFPILRSIMSEEQWELKLWFATICGKAYLEDSSGNEYFRLGQGHGISLAASQDHSPQMLQGTSVDSLAEQGKKFSNFKEAEHYLDALQYLNKMMLIAFCVEDRSKTEERRKKALDIFIEMQATIKKDYLGVLNTIPDFDVFRKYVDMSPEEIFDDLRKIKTESEPNVLSSFYPKPK